MDGCIVYFWLVSVQVQFGVIRCISDFYPAGTCCISETANRRAELYGPNLISWDVCSVYRVRLTVTCSSSVWGHLVHFRFSATLYVEKKWLWGETDQNLGLRGRSFVHTEYVSLLSVQMPVWGHSVHFHFLSILNPLLTSVFRDLCTANFITYWYYFI